MNSSKLRALEKALFHFNQFERDRWVEEQAKMIPPNSRVLDVGAGPCRYRNLFKHCVYKAHDFAELPTHPYGHLDYISDILEIPVSSKSFDVILCTEVIEHVPEPIKALKEFYRIIKPGGKLLLTAPLGSGIHQEPYHYYGGFTPYWYRHFLPMTGFEETAIEANQTFYKYYGQETIRFCNYIKSINKILYLVFFPLKIIVPIIGYYLNSHDREKRFVVGYHITACRRA